MLFGPAKAANAGGVATSGLEMSQNSMRHVLDLRGSGREAAGHHDRTFSTTPMTPPRHTVRKGNLMVGANVAGFIKVADAMLAEGIAY